MFFVVSFVISSRLNIFVCIIIAALNKIKYHPDATDYFKELPFCNKYIENTKTERLKNIDLLSELPFYEELNVTKTNHALRGYAMSYKVKLVEKKGPIKQLEASESSIKDLFSDFLDETKGFKYQIILKVFLKNTKALKSNLLQLISIQQHETVINQKCSIENDLQEILCRIDN